MKLYGLALTACLILGLSAAAPGQDKKEPTNREKIVGTWESKDGEVIEFAKDGKMKVSIKLGDKTITVDGTYTVEGDKLNISVKDDKEKKEETVTIKQLDDKVLVTVDKDKKEDKLTRKK